MLAIMPRRPIVPCATTVLAGLAVSFSMVQQLASAFSLSAARCASRGAACRLGSGAGEVGNDAHISLGKLGADAQVAVCRIAHVFHQQVDVFF